MTNTEELWLEGGGMREVYKDDYVDSLLVEIERLRAIEAAARNLLQVKGRHHTELAYKRLEEVLK